MGTYTINSTPEQITTIIRQRYPETEFAGSRIKVRGHFWKTFDLKIISGPMPTTLKSAWHMSMELMILFVIVLICSLGLGIILGIIHYIMNMSYADELIQYVNYAIASGPMPGPYPSPYPPYPPQQPPPQY